MICECAAELWRCKTFILFIFFFHISNLRNNNNNHNESKGEQLNQINQIVAKDFHVLLRSTIYSLLFYYID